MSMDQFKQADVATVIEILKGLLAGELSREAVAAWCEARTKKVPYDEEDPNWTYPVHDYEQNSGNEAFDLEGLWTFDTLRKVNVGMDNGPGEDPYFLRTHDLQNILERLLKHPEPRSWNGLVEMSPEQMRENRMYRVWLITFFDPNRPTYWPEGLWSFRSPDGVIEYVEHCFFYYQDVPWMIWKPLGADDPHRHHLFISMFTIGPDDFNPVMKSEPLVDLLRVLDVHWDHKQHFDSRRMPVEPYGLYRHDENGEELMVKRFTTFVAAEMTRQSYEDRGVNQGYYLKRLPDDLLDPACFKRKPQAWGSYMPKDWDDDPRKPWFT